jgi:hypothetical protein
MAKKERNERYSDTQAIELLQRCTTVRTLPVAKARQLFADLLRARLNDVVVSEPTELVRSASDEHVSGLQKGIYSWLSMMTEAKGNWPPIGLGPVQALIAKAGDVELRVGGALTTMLTLKTYVLLGRVGARLLRCECGELLVKVKRQAFCSQTCQKRFQARRLRGDKSPIE